MLMAVVTPRHTHLVKHPVSETQELGEEVEPAVQEGEEAEQQEHDTCGRRRVEEELQFWASLRGTSSRRRATSKLALLFIYLFYLRR